MSSSETSSAWAAIRFAFSRTCSTAIRIAPPPTAAPRLPNVPTPVWVIAVSPWSTTISSMPTPSCVADDLGHRRLGALAVRRRAGVDHHLAGRLDAHRRALPRAEAADLDVGADADPDDPALVAGLLLLLAELRVPRDLQRLVERLDVLAGVVVGAERRLVRELVGRDEVDHAGPRPGPAPARAPPCRWCTPAGTSPRDGRPRDTPRPGSCW